MPTTFWIITAVIVFDAVFIPLLIRALVSSSWNPIAEDHPDQPIPPDAVRKNFQSYRVNLFNLGYMIHTAVDDRFLHLRPAALGRWLGMRPASIPWDQLQPVKQGRLYTAVKLGTKTIHGPTWALAFAFNTDDHQVPADNTK